MANTDSFLDEVTEEVRQDRMFRLWKRYGPYVLGAVFLAVAGAAFWQWRASQQEVAAQNAGGALSGASQVDDAAQRADAFVDVIARVGDEPALLAQFGEAAAAGEAGDMERAQAIYAQISADLDLPKRWTALADLKAAALLLDAGDTEAALTAAQPLAAEGEPYRLLAIELQAIAYALSGDAAQAQAAFETILSDPSATPTLQGRAAEFLRSMGVEPS